ncbi:type I-E CRISPR-associated protein Cas6/Cse3/CasE [Arcanobacterium hippocoleae]|uniref:CRISPR system Cascade subunit CasE n=1 Tax=Arcanobacterium hippocoleae TaxID=149017 RepID=A0ABU1T392_9ACTO|nr:type I-E CRISPR-associated protein Cas6/Cse3/CasE [Arcanobacterium hippocoleae]MDR6939331.1 CRISPR system Cascade subunit CasE [Arcanobacterium hippocoleae]
MYFTRIELNAVRRQTRKLLGNPEAMHAAVSSLFPRSLEETGRLLWRVDRLREALYVYLVSEKKPDAASLIEQAGWETAPAQIADYSAFLDQLTKGQQYAFKLCANPTRTIWIPGSRGKRVPHVTAHQQLQWFLNKTEALGISCVGESESENPTVQITRRGQQLVYKRANQRVPITYAVFEGLCTVTNPELLRKALCEGVGREKAYGYGLLTLAKPE